MPEIDIMEEDDMFENLMDKDDINTSLLQDNSTLDQYLLNDDILN